VDAILQPPDCCGCDITATGLLWMRYYSHRIAVDAILQLPDCCGCDITATGFIKDRELCYCLADYYFVV
jgi:hypothetical protein